MEYCRVAQFFKSNRAAVLLSLIHISNPLLRWYGEVLGSKYQEGKYSHLLYWLADKKNCETIVYRNEILLVYDLDESKRIVLFYDPFFQRMNGYSLNL